MYICLVHVYVVPLHMYICMSGTRRNNNIYTQSACSTQVIK